MKLSTNIQDARFVTVQLPFLDLMKDSPLSSDLYITEAGYEPNINRHYTISGGDSDRYTLLYCTQGSCFISSGNKIFEFSFNHYLIVNDIVDHRLIIDPHNPITLYWVSFKGSKAAVYAQRCQYPINIPPSPFSRIEERLELFESIYTILNQSEITIDHVNYANSILNLFIATFVYAEIYKVSNPNFASAEHNVINKVTHYMSENIENNLTLNDFAQYAGYSASYFYRKFIKEVEIAPMEYFTRLKINKASIYLIKSDLSIRQIATKLGFSTPDYFSRTFKKVLGISPVAFRKENFRL